MVVAGTRAWLHDTTLVSSGSGDLDAAVGGGLPVRSLVLVRGPVEPVVRVFGGEGIARGQAVMEVGRNGLTWPAVRKGKGSVRKQESELRIAWRYGAQQEKRKEVSLGLGFDLSKTMEEELLEQNHSVYIRIVQWCEERYESVLKELHRVLEERSCIRKAPVQTEGGFSIPSPLRGVLRVILHDVFSPKTVAIQDEKSLKEFLRFLHRLRSAVRTADAICMFTIPPNALPKRWIQRLEHYFDGIFSFSPFRDAQTRQQFGDEYDGIMEICRFPLLNTWRSPVTDSVRYLYHVGRKELRIEPMHLPPEESREGTGGSSCVPGKNVDF